MLKTIPLLVGAAALLIASTSSPSPARGQSPTPTPFYIPSDRPQPYTSSPSQAKEQPADFAVRYSFD